MPRLRTIGLALLLILGLLGMHVLSGAAPDHGAHPAMLAADPAAAAGSAAVPGSTDGAVVPLSGGDEDAGVVQGASDHGLTGDDNLAAGGLCAERPEGAMAACLLALLTGVLLLLLPFRPALGALPRRGLVCVAPRVLRVPRPPSLHVLSISRT